MDQRRAETLEALSAYVRQQRALLARTQADIERLKQRRGPLAIAPLEDCRPALPDKLDWDVFSSCDATPLRTLAVRARIERTQRAVPFNAQRTPLSFLQRFVKDARRVMLDPVLSSLDEDEDEDVPEPMPTKKRKTEPPDAGTARIRLPAVCCPSDTYKLAWTVSEQHLLERLLQEIPDGEKNRWAKISQAMGGRRTPRQVASRVQKYFEKLKRFGVGPS